MTSLIKNYNEIYIARLVATRNIIKKNKGVVSKKCNTSFKQQIRIR